MLLFVFTLLLGIVSTVSGAAFLPIRQFNSTNSSSAGCGVAETTIVSFTTTVYSPPQTITIAVENYTSISASLASAFSVDSIYVSDQSELAPVSEPTFATTHTFKHTIVVPLVTATKAINSTSGVYYVSIGPNTTDFNYTPTGSTVVGTTTFTVEPVQSSSEVQATTTLYSTTHSTITTTLSREFPLTTGGIFTGPSHMPYGSYNGGSYGWNASSHATLRGGTSGFAVSSEGHVVTITEVSTVATVTINVTASPTLSATMANGTYANATTAHASICTDEPGYNSSVVSLVSSHGKRQICTLVYATISGNLASWCNNWDGTSVFHLSTHTSTFTPSPWATASPAAASTSSSSISVTALTSASVIPSVVSSTSMTTSSTSTSPAATSCGQTGVFEINFDGLPQYSPSNNDTADFPPIFNPYEHFFWGNCWAYGPPPTEPYPPQGGSHLGECIPSLADNQTNSPNAGTLPDGGFGAGPRAYNSDYWFNAESAYVGCDNGATDGTACDFVATGYQWDAVSQKEHVVVTEHFPQPPCPNFQNCQLKQIFFNSEFVQLSSLVFYGNVLGQLKIFWVDTMELSWYNNTCAAGLARMSAQ